MLNYNKSILSNKLKTIFIPMRQTNAVTVLILVNTGSRFEDKKQNGISHFLEHLFFKGTKKRPDTLSIAKQLDMIGANYNAFTSEEYTGFYVRCAKTKLEKAVEILSDIILNSKFDQKEINKEKGVIVEEINMYEDLPQKQIIDLTKKHFFGDSPLGRSTLGPKKNIRAFKQADFLKYKNEHYTSDNSIFVIAGNANTDYVKKLAEKYFSKLTKKKSKKYKKADKIKQKPSVFLKYKKTDQAHITLAVETFKRSSPERYKLKIINNILGETMSSRLFSEIREKRGLAYYVGSDKWYFDDAGILVCYAGVDTKRIEESIKVINEQIELLAKNSITKEELQKAKDNVEGIMYLGLEDSFSVAEYFAEQALLYDKILKPTEVVKILKNISLEDINNFAKKLFERKKVKLTIIGPYRSDNKFIKLIK